MPETLDEAIKHAAKIGYPKSQVISRKNDNTSKKESYIAPRALKTAKDKRKYAALRQSGKDAETAAKIATAAAKKCKGKSKSK